MALYFMVTLLFEQPHYQKLEDIAVKVTLIFFKATPKEVTRSIMSEDIISAKFCLLKY
jgi:hypothetical protein